MIKSCEILVVIGIAISYNIQQGDAISCWTCSSQIDPGCDDPFIESLMMEYTDCDSYDTYIKTCMAMRYSYDGTILIRRQCGFPSRIGSYRKGNKYSKNVPDVYFCVQDGCNTL